MVHLVNHQRIPRSHRVTGGAIWAQTVVCICGFSRKAEYLENKSLTSSIIIILQFLRDFFYAFDECHKSCSLFRLELELFEF